MTLTVPRIFAVVIAIVAFLHVVYGLGILCGGYPEKEFADGSVRIAVGCLLLDGIRLRLQRY